MVQVKYPKISVTTFKFHLIPSGITHKNKLKLTELESEITILEHFIAMSHHNGIPSYLFKQISTILIKEKGSICFVIAD